MEELESH